MAISSQFTYEVLLPRGREAIAPGRQMHTAGMEPFIMISLNVASEMSLVIIPSMPSDAMSKILSGRVAFGRWTSRISQPMRVFA